MARILYMVVEHFKNRDAAPVYQRFLDRGRMAPMRRSIDFSLCLVIALTAELTGTD